MERQVLFTQHLVGQSEQAGLGGQALKSHEGCVQGRALTVPQLPTWGMVGSTLVPHEADQEVMRNKGWQRLIGVEKFRDRQAPRFMEARIANC